MEKLSRLLMQMEFIKEIDKLKYIQRKTKLFNSERHENDAEHSWHLAMMVMVLSEYSNAPVDVLKVLKMVLIHDIVEIDAGDTFLYDTTKNHTNTDEELIAAHRIFGILPEEQAKDFLEIWTEFENGETSDAKFAKAIDRLEPILQNISNQGGTWTEYNVPFEVVYEKIDKIKDGSGFLWDHVDELIEEFRKKV
ncbi:putative hydrolases of HD superfamily [Pedobacter westerhofensis]|uniref:5'-deoxynucleotidase n=1 Tax=Pedobacter westerhofensis TaxID=425512 RepID=A0A521FGX7_9SPHI|nr:HD domain-containing protein [Pedobacter westerhofensis]SMO95443.1 putative hydrolases of HD superfamily [Pedobacter westerhofensis]